MDCEQIMDTLMKTQETQEPLNNEENKKILIHCAECQECNLFMGFCNLSPDRIKKKVRNKCAYFLVHAYTPFAKLEDLQEFYLHTTHCSKCAQISFDHFSEEARNSPISEEEEKAIIKKLDKLRIQENIAWYIKLFTGKIKL
ncbi:MAG: hypothetical protein G01um101418_638 [Parcubacteria group bacterium Gr01-1014_18]|nr:MAG: hypothetical protein Greene041636_651 [Parcubacteria group bacterium Greene0416_36]TSC80719.1 MAG: hypothetical protein G01um101418_638 [Parcubacteria group bacterium Gr01-1014_18]TSC98670.1 MAG: hypothetical protein Greene101420_629 [Parcubacteria group bacterium Greene1014_20]TSD07170.1 MAG: hypothetical protein Greene07142_339 [Parcubacteria group bacterium Greene0714_2]